VTVGFTSQNAPCSSAELRALEIETGHLLPQDFVDFLSLRNGGRLESNLFNISTGNESGVNEYLNVARIIDRKGVLRDRLSPSTWPIAEAEGGNYVCLRWDAPDSWCVVFWDHESEDEAVLSESFSEFRDSLQKFDPRTVKLQPGQVVSAWIDPSLMDSDDGSTSDSSPRMGTSLIVDERDFGAVPIDFLAGQLASLTESPHMELWLARSDGPSLCILKSGGRCLLMYMREEGDEGLTSRSATPFGSDAKVTFRLSNGQLDTYAQDWTVDYAEARRVAEYFWFHGQPAPFIAWE
jgi:hypothetical protein